MKILKIIISLALITTVVGCRNTIEFPGTNVELGFSSDTIYLDTVFGTGQLDAYPEGFNPSDENITIDRVFGPRSRSFYRMNVDGISGKDVENVEYWPKTALYLH